MSLTATVVDRQNAGSKYEVVADVTFDSAYPSGGETFAHLAEVLGLPNQVIDSLVAERNATHFFRTDYANGKLLAFPVATPQTQATGDLATVTARVRARGH